MRRLLDAIDLTARACPSRTALTGRAGALGYGELAARADALAVHLTRTLPRGVPVVVLGHKEPELVTCFLACLRSGRAYVPVDDGLPAARIARVVAHSGAGLVLAPAGTSVALSAPVLGGPALRATITRHLGARPPAAAAVQPGDDAYIIYTSGSTGDPKGVRITLDNLTGFVAWARATHPVEGGLRFLNQAPFSFDLSVMDLYLWLVTGGTLHLIDREHLGNPLALRDALAAADVQLWVSTPSFLEMCLGDRRFTTGHLPGLRRVFLCGEALSIATVTRLRERFPGAAAYDLYGPTEATVAVTSLRLDAAMLGRWAALPLGRPRPDTRLYLVDPDGHEITDERPGELVIEGPCVSPGYLDAPTLTERAFAGQPPHRRYRTGDRGCRRDGEIFFAGRLDFQVKLDGNRIELDDVAANLSRLAAVEAAVALPVMVDGRCQAIVAFVRLEPGAGRTGEALRQELGALVPPYMVPREVRCVDVLPLTANGKIDRARLAAAIGEAGA